MKFSRSCTSSEDANNNQNKSHNGDVGNSASPMRIPMLIALSKIFSAPEGFP